MEFNEVPAAGAPDSPEPYVSSTPEIVHGIGNLVQNAVQFARNTVRVTTRWTDQQVEITITDDGPGFSSLVLERIGEPYISMRDDDLNVTNHMGLGIFIAQTLLQRTGATVRFGNLPGGGAQVAVLWDRAILERSSVGVES